jgi:hypothetical protein
MPARLLYKYTLLHLFILIKEVYHPRPLGTLYHLEIIKRAPFLLSDSPRIANNLVDFTSEFLVKRFKL